MGVISKQIASLTKVATFLLTDSLVNAGKITWDDAVVVSPAAAKVGGTTAGIKAGEQYSVRRTCRCLSVAAAGRRESSLRWAVAVVRSDARHDAAVWKRRRDSNCRIRWKRLS